MLIQSNNFIPQVYSKERDMQVFTTLIDVILSCCKYDIDNLSHGQSVFQRERNRRDDAEE